MINVYRIQNAAIYEQFRRKALEEAARPWLTEQRNAYHVTRAENLKDLLLEGLDQRLAARGRFGRGLYFAEDPRKSDFYWKGSKDPSAVRMMLRTKVLLGRKKPYSPGESYTDAAYMNEAYMGEGPDGRRGPHGSLVLGFGCFWWLPLLISQLSPPRCRALDANVPCGNVYTIHMCT